MRKYSIINRIMSRITTRHLYKFLLLFFMVSYLTETQADSHIVTFYVTDDGIIATIGLESKKEPEKVFSVGIHATDHELLLVSPNFTQDVYPLKALTFLMKKFGDQFSQTLTAGNQDVQALLTGDNKKKMPVKIYISAAGADSAAGMKPPEKDKVSDYIDDSNKKCLKKKNKKEFHSCMFQKAIQAITPERRVVEYKTEQDHQLAVAITHLYDKKPTADGKASDNHPILMLHLTTEMTTAFLKANGMENKDIFTKKMGMSSLGDRFCQGILSYKHCHYLNTVKKIRGDDEEKEKKGSTQSQKPDLVSAVYNNKTLSDYLSSDTLALQEPQYNPPYHYPLISRPHNHKLFGNLVAQTARNNGQTFVPISTTPVTYDTKHAREMAAHHVEDLMKKLLVEITGLYLSSCWSASDVKDLSHQEVLPQLILLGEHTNLLEGLDMEDMEDMEGLDGSDNQEIFRTFGLGLFQRQGFLTLLLRDLPFKGDDSVTRDTLCQWQNRYLAPIIENARVMSRSDFVHSLHEGAVQRLAALK